MLFFPPFGTFASTDCVRWMKTVEISGRMPHTFGVYRIFFSFSFLWSKERSLLYVLTGDLFESLTIYLSRSHRPTSKMAKWNKSISFLSLSFLRECVCLFQHFKCEMTVQNAKHSFQKKRKKEHYAANNKLEHLFRKDTLI